MPTSFTTNLRLSNPGLGDTGWGSTVSNGMIDLTDQAIAGQASVNVTAAGPFVLTMPDGVSGDARNMFLRFTGNPGGAREVQVPTNRKLYFVTNDSDGAVTVKVSGQTGVVVPVGASMALRINAAGTDVVQALTYQATLSIGTLTLTNALGATSGGTGQTGYAVGDLLYADTTTTLAKLAGVATGNALLSGGVGTAPAWGKVGLTTHVSGTLPVANGGTGQTTATAAFDALKQAATDTYTGVVELATTAEVQAGTDTTRAITPSALRNGALVRGTAQNTTSGTFIDFTGIPSWVKRVTVLFSEVSTNGTSTVIVQLGTSSGVTTSGYLSAAQQPAAGSTSTAGFVIDGNSIASMDRCGAIVLVNMTGNLWVSSGDIAQRPGTPSTEVSSSGGRVTLSGALDRIRITTSNGTDAFDAGSVNIVYE